MRVDKERLAALAAMPDGELWAEIVKIAGTYGINMPQGVPPHAELERLRSTVTGARMNVGEALRILNGYRKSDK